MLNLYTFQRMEPSVSPIAFSQSEIHVAATDLTEACNYAVRYLSMIFNSYALQSHMTTHRTSTEYSEIILYDAEKVVNLRFLGKQTNPDFLEVSPSTKIIYFKEE